MKNLWCLFFFFCSGTIHAQQEAAYVIDPNASARILTGSFDAIELSGGISLYLSQSGEEGLAVSGSEEKYKDNIKTKIEGSTLKIFYEGEKNWNAGRKKLRVYVSFKKLTKLTASGASKVLATGEISGSTLKIELSGLSDFKGKVNLDNLDLDLSGASDAHLEGKASTVNIECSGSSDVNGFDLVSNDCTAKASGASDIHLTINKTLTAHASGASDILYRGAGVIKEVQTSGSSSVEKEE